ncbi:MAG: multiubiquitin domain-containing protein [Bdellovibrionales bacterium]|nr:multiubiquitin domain-containing protein [Bdellovibrionales bacterium]
MKHIKISIQGKGYEVKPGLTQIKEIYNITKMEEKQILFLKQKDEIDIPLNQRDFILLRGGEQFSLSDKPTKIDNNPCLRVPLQPILNGNAIGADKALVTPKIKGCSLKALDSEAKSGDLLYADTDGCPDALIPDDITLVVQKNDRFIVIPCRDKAVDLEECAKKDRKPPKGQKSYRIKIDGEKYKVKEEKINGTEILSLVGKTYKEWSLNQKFCGGRRVPIKLDDFVDLTQKGVERFETVRKQAQQGSETARFLLPNEDTEYLKVNFPKWKRLIEGSKKGLVILNYRLPEGYIPRKADLMIMIPDDYPTANIDMFYFSPDIRREDGVAIEALSSETHFGRNWQRWSRHYNWQAGFDNIVRHISYVHNQLKFEIDKE